MITKTRKRADTVFRAIADPTRRRILGLLRADRQPVGEIAAHFRMSRPAISKHLRLLRAAGLVTTRKEGAARICGLNARPLRPVGAWLQDYEAFWGDSLHGLKRYVEADQAPKEKHYGSGKRKRRDRTGDRDPRAGKTGF